MEEGRVEVPNKASVYVSFLTCLLALDFSMRSVDLRLRMRITPAFRPKARSPSRAVRCGFDRARGSEETAEQYYSDMLRSTSNLGGA